MPKLRNLHSRRSDRPCSAPSEHGPTTRQSHICYMRVAHKWASVRSSRSGMFADRSGRLHRCFANIAGGASAVRCQQFVRFLYGFPIREDLLTKAGRSGSRTRRCHRGDSSVAFQSRGGESRLSSRVSVSAAARCTASHGLRAHAAPACDVRECSKPLWKKIARQPRPLLRRSSSRIPRGQCPRPHRRYRASCRSKGAYGATRAPAARARETRARREGGRGGGLVEPSVSGKAPWIASSRAELTVQHCASSVVSSTHSRVRDRMLEAESMHEIQHTPGVARDRACRPRVGAPSTAGVGFRPEVLRSRRQRSSPDQNLRSR